MKVAKSKAEQISDSETATQTVGQVVAANLLAIMRSNKRLTDAQVVRLAGLSKGYLPKLRDGSIVDPPYSKLKEIARACGVSLDALVSGYAPPAVTLLPAAYFAFRHGLQAAGQVQLVMNLAGRLAVEAVLPAESEAASFDSQPLIVPEPATGKAATLQHLATLLSFLASLLCYYLEQEQFSSLSVRAEFSTLRPLYRRLNQPQRYSVQLTASTLADKQAAKGGSGLRQRIELLSGEVRRLLDTSGRVSQPGAGRGAKLPAVALDTQTLGQRIIHNLEPVFKLGVSERALEQAAGLGKTYLRSLRIGQTAEPGYSDVHRLAMATGLTVEYLVHGKYPDQPLSTDPHLLNPEYFYRTGMGLNNQLAIRALEMIVQLLGGGGRLAKDGLGQSNVTTSDDLYDPLALEIEELWRLYNQLPDTERNIMQAMVNSIAT